MRAAREDIVGHRKSDWAGEKSAYDGVRQPFWKRTIKESIVRKI